MHIISKKKLREFWAENLKSKLPLEAWHQIARKANWRNFGEVKATFASADRVGRFVVFDIGGNKFRLIAAIHFNRGKLYVRHVLTHADYDTGKWKQG
jgi:mRNA interferase HigB